ncbi:hypothetical protein Cgig2_018326 [Carnegiea gigantea]|uniref:Uncharacterized protein n=1 Tax=Carnegiea gigantea TaxID=171969 RepID=A0A9Q1QRB6_9CARY|nr:hypothetical protein Cgig2_018326 [Carnegiea gigantea]
MKGQVSIPSSRSCDGRLNMLLKKLTFNVPQLALVAGSDSKLTQPLDSTSDLVTMIPTVILGAEVLGSEFALAAIEENLSRLSCRRIVLGATQGESLSGHRDEHGRSLVHVGCSLEVVINEGYCFIPSVDIGQKGISLNGLVSTAVIYGPSFGNSSLTIEAEGSNCGASVETRWLLITLEHLSFMGFKSCLNYGAIKGSICLGHQGQYQLNLMFGYQMCLQMSVTAACLSLRLDFGSVPLSYSDFISVLNFGTVVYDSMELLKVTEAFVPGAKCQLEGVTASFTQPLDAANDPVTLIPNCDLGAEFLGSEVGFVFVGLQQGISLNGFSVLYGPRFGNSSLTIEAEGSKRDGWLETGWLLITLEHLSECSMLELQSRFWKCPENTLETTLKLLIYEIHIDSMDESSKFGSVGLPEAEELVKYVASREAQYDK